MGRVLSGVNSQRLFSFYFVFSFLIVGHVLVRMWLEPGMEVVPALGDENTQVRMLDAGRLIWHEYFMPGTVLFLLPLQAFGDFDLSGARVISAVASLPILVFAGIAIKRAFGIPIALVTTASLLIFVDFHVMSFGLWAEHIGSLLLVIQVALLSRIIGGKSKDEGSLWPEISLAVLTFCIFAYFRQNSILIPPIVLVASLLIGFSRYLDGSAFPKYLIALPVLFFLSLLVLAPWWTHLSEVAGETRIRATSYEINLATKYGLEKLPDINPTLALEVERKVAQNPGTNNVGNIRSAIKVVAARGEATTGALLGDLRNAVIQSITIEKLLEKVPPAYKRLLFGGGIMTGRVVPYVVKDAPDAALADIPTMRSLRKANRKALIAAFVGAFLFVLWPFGRSIQGQAEVIVFTGFFLTAMVLPFVHKLQGRHNTLFIVLMVLGTLLFFRQVIATWRAGGLVALLPVTKGERFLFLIRTAGSVLLAGMAVLIWSHFPHV